MDQDTQFTSQIEAILSKLFLPKGFLNRLYFSEFRSLLRLSDLLFWKIIIEIPEDY
jgi:hypothetical protein